ncbi:aldo/keto reductase [soil metagenome]
MASSSLRWGIIGTGSIAKKFASELPHSRTGRLVAVASRSLEMAQAFAGDFGSIRAHGSYEALLADPEVDAVYISTPHPQHAEWAVACAEARKHILCEKPLTMNYAEAMVVVEAARRNGVFLMEAFMYKCHPRTVQIWKLVNDGAIGRVRLIQSAFSFRAAFHPESRLFNNSLGGGGILDVGCYAASVARMVAGAAVGEPFQNPISVTGAGLLCETGVDTLATASLTFPGDILAQISCGVAMNHGADLVIHGEDGRIKVSAFWNPPGPIEVHNLAANETTVLEGEGNELPYKYALEADALADALPKLESQLVSVADTLGNMQVLDAWRLAAGVRYASEQSGATVQSLPLSRRPLRPNRFGEIPKAELPGLTKCISRLVLGIDNQHTAPYLAAMADDFLERGGNAFDTAFIYGGGLQEQLLGRWMENREIRNEVVLTVKGAHTPTCDPSNLQQQFTLSLERLRTDYADIYIMHRDNPAIPVGEFVDVLDELHRAGKIGLYGGSNWSMERLQEANDYARLTGKKPFQVVSNNLSLARMVTPVWNGCVSAKGADWRRWLLENEVALLAWSSQARGYFVPGLAGDAETLRCWDSPDNQERRRRAEDLAKAMGVTPINVALAYVLSQPFRSLALFGPRTIEETRTSLRGLDIVLSPGELAWLDLESDSKP